MCGVSGLDHIAHLPQDGGDDPRGAALSARLVADQLGHSRPSRTQDVYLRALALEAALAGLPSDPQDNGKRQLQGRLWTSDVVMSWVLCVIRDSNPEPAGKRRAVFGVSRLDTDLPRDLRECPLAPAGLNPLLRTFAVMAVA
jgi:hypothetical protein